MDQEPLQRGVQPARREQGNARARRDGRSAGDAVVCRLAQVLSDAARTADYAARYHEGQFTLILDGLELDATVQTAEKIRRAIATAGGTDVKFVVNTHWHGDHTGGNGDTAAAGARIYAHDNVRKRLSTDQFMEAFNRKVPASPEIALPVLTFGSRMTLHHNGEEIVLTHVAPAHTDGDILVHFTKANVLHCGDLFFNGMYPFIDSSDRKSTRLNSSHT